jgi:hypothetical protein
MTTKVQLVSNIVGNVSGGASFTGIVTAAGGFNLGISSAGTTITSGPVKTLNFVGSGNTFAVSGTTVDISISGGGSGGGIGTAIKYADNTTSPFSYIDSQITVTSNLNLDTTNAGASNSYVVSAVPNITVASGVGITVGAGKTMIIDILQIGDL